MIQTTKAGARWAGGIAGDHRAEFLAHRPTATCRMISGGNRHLPPGAISSRSSRSWQKAVAFVAIGIKLALIVLGDRYV